MVGVEFKVFGCFAGSEVVVIGCVYELVAFIDGFFEEGAETVSEMMSIFFREVILFVDLIDFLGFSDFPIKDSRFRDDEVEEGLGFDLFFELQGKRRVEVFVGLSLGIFDCSHHNIFILAKVIVKVGWIMKFPIFIPTSSTPVNNLLIPLDQLMVNKVIR